MGKVVFVSEAEKNELLRIVRSPLSQENIIGHCFEKTGISEGVFPVEIGVRGMPEVLFEETPESIRIAGSAVGGAMEKIFASGIHVGHRITKILKQ